MSKSLNREEMVFHLKEASEQLENLISLLEDKEYNDDYLETQGFVIGAIEHIYHHLNNCYNVRFGEPFAEELDQGFELNRRIPHQVVTSLGITEET